MLRRLQGMRIVDPRACIVAAALLVTSLPVSAALASPDGPGEMPPTPPDTVPDSTPPPVAPSTTVAPALPPEPVPPTTSATAPAPTTPPSEPPPATAPPTTAPPVTSPPAPPAPPAPPVTQPPAAPSPPAVPDRPPARSPQVEPTRRTWARGCITHTLRPRDHNRQVRCLQVRLRWLGYPVPGDGFYGLRTADAVAQIKRRAGLHHDKTAGPEALDRIFSPRMVPIRAWGGCITRQVEPGDRGYQVGCLSRRLRALNFPVRVDRRYAARERYSINHIKRHIRLPQDGIAGPDALDSIFDRDRKRVRVWGNCIVDVLSPGARGYQVGCLQRRLKRLNLLAGVDRYFGLRTAAAVDAMRYRAGLSQDGVAGPKALTRIFRAPLPAPIRPGFDETGHQLSVVSVAGPSAPSLPAGSGSGRRIVYSRAHQRVWAVGADGHIVRSWLVSGSLYGNEQPGVHQVFSKSLYAYAYTGSGVVLPYMVRYYTTPRGNNIGFHEIPSNSSGPIMSEWELGQPRSAGCTRQARLDAIFLWDWAPVGTNVVVV